MSFLVTGSGGNPNPLYEKPEGKDTPTNATSNVKDLIKTSNNDTNGVLDLKNPEEDKYVGSGNIDLAGWGNVKEIKASENSSYGYTYHDPNENTDKKGSIA